MMCNNVSCIQCIYFFKAIFLFVLTRELWTVGNSRMDRVHTGSECYSLHQIRVLSVKRQHPGDRKTQNRINERKRGLNREGAKGLQDKRGTNNKDTSII